MTATAIRAVAPSSPVRGLELRASEDGTDSATLYGHFAVFNQWTRVGAIDWDTYEYYEFMERIAPGAFLRTMSEDRAGMRCCFQHGRDPATGSKPLGPIRTLREDEIGAYYEVDLIATAYVRELVPGIRAGLYGASFAFRITREEYVEAPEPSEYNALGLPERTVLETKVHEFGPVVWGQYEDATAYVRALYQRETA
jgi:HK97 family phage prohead protease